MPETTIQQIASDSNTAFWLVCQARSINAARLTNQGVPHAAAIRYKRKFFSCANISFAGQRLAGIADEGVALVRRETYHSGIFRSENAGIAKEGVAFLRRSGTSILLGNTLRASTWISISFARQQGVALLCYISL